MDRRGFFGWVCGSIAGLFGVGKLVVASSNDTTDESGEGPRLLGQGAARTAHRIVEKYRKEFPDWEEPAPRVSWLLFEAGVTGQLLFTDKVLVWRVPNKLGGTMELQVMPTIQMVPSPAVLPDYPAGYYRFTPLYPHAILTRATHGMLMPHARDAVGMGIPAEQVDVYKL